MEMPLARAAPAESHFHSIMTLQNQFIGTSGDLQVMAAIPKIELVKSHVKFP
jgi:hypothetical protein